ncbi:MAG TPA: DUF3552 domain-containing protein, partial [Bacteroidetes bacterium]|nr:DUF3552 domain-containing protein [Bacteroidota bacterium]
MNTLYLIIALAAFLAGAVSSYFLISLKLRGARKTSEDMIRDARREIEREKHQTLIKAKEDWFRLRDEQENELRKRAEKMDEIEARLLDREKQLESREEVLKQREGLASQKEHELTRQREALHVKDAELSRIITAQNEALSKVCNLSIEEAREKLIENLKKEYRRDAAELYKTLVDEARSNANREARKIITQAIEKQAAEYASELAVSVVNLPTEEVKGRIIGKDGRNIKAFEQLSGVKLIVDDTPEAVVLSSFDPVKREVARVALEKLISSGKIHPQRIEEVLKAAEQEVDKSVWRAGNEVVASV